MLLGEEGGAEVRGLVGGWAGVGAGSRGVPAAASYRLLLNTLLYPLDQLLSLELTVAAGEAPNTYASGSG